MATNSERQEQISLIQDLPHRLESVVVGLSQEELDAPGPDGGWSVRQIVHHLADSHMNGFIRTRLILTEEKPPLKTYDQPRWAALADSAQMPPEVSLVLLQALHARWVYLLDQLDEEDWQRAGVHPEWGEINLEYVLGTYAKHCIAHLEQIAGNIEALRAAQ